MERTQSLTMGRAQYEFLSIFDKRFETLLDNLLSEAAHTNESVFDLMRLQGMIDAFKALTIGQIDSQQLSAFELAVQKRIIRLVKTNEIVFATGGQTRKTRKEIRAELNQIKQQLKEESKAVFTIQMALSPQGENRDNIIIHVNEMGEILENMDLKKDIKGEILQAVKEKGVAGKWNVFLDVTRNGKQYDKDNFVADVFADFSNIQIS